MEKEQIPEIFLSFLSLCTFFFFNLSLSLFSLFSLSPSHPHVLPDGSVDRPADRVVQHAHVHAHLVGGRDGDALRLGVCLFFDFFLKEFFFDFFSSERGSFLSPPAIALFLRQKPRKQKYAPP